jgi:hypothetical protein
MQIKKVVGWAIVVFLAYYLVTKPHAAGHAVQGLFNMLKSAGDSLATFFSSL